MSQTDYKSLLSTLFLLALLSFGFLQSGMAQANNYQVTAGVWHSCALDDNEVQCWGYGQITMPSLTHPTIRRVFLK